MYVSLCFAFYVCYFLIYTNTMHVKRRSLAVSFAVIRSLAKIK